MSDRYEPKSEFLKSFDHEIVPLSGSDFANQNLVRIVALTSDKDESNREWATFYLSQSDVANDLVINALLARAKDEHTDTRAEAVLGLARRNHPKTVELLVETLRGEIIGVMDLEAAGTIADSSLLPELRELLASWADEPEDDEHVELIKRAIAACETGDHDEYLFFRVDP